MLGERLGLPSACSIEQLALSVANLGDINECAIGGERAIRLGMRAPSPSVR